MGVADYFTNKPITMAEAEALRVGKPITKGLTRLAEKTADDQDEKAKEKAWRKAVIKEDGKVCRRCKRKVVQQLELAPEQLHVHHVAPRVDQAVRWDVRNGMVLCATCHEKVTRYVLLLVQQARYLFRVDGVAKTYINARKPVTFKEAA